MTFKRILSLSLAISIATPTSFALGQISPQNDDVASLVLRSQMAGSPEEAKVLLDSARQKLSEERLSPDQNRRLQELIARTERSLQTARPAAAAAAAPAPGGGSQYSAPAGSGQEAGRAEQDPGFRLGRRGPPLIAFDDPQTEELLKSVTEAPEVRTTLRELGRGRMDRDAKDIPRIVERNTGKTPRQLDQEEEQRSNSGGSYISGLISAGLIKSDFRQANKDLRERLDSLSTEELAWAIFSDQRLYSASAAAARGFLEASQAGSGLRAMGASAENLGSFIFNANMVLRIADLYGVRPNQAEQEVLLLTLWAISRRYTVYIPNAIARDLVTARLMGKKWVEARTSRNPRASVSNFFRQVFRSRLVSAPLNRLGVMPDVTDNVADATARSHPQNNPANPAPAANAGPVATNGNATPAATNGASGAQQPSPGGSNSADSNKRPGSEAEVETNQSWGQRLKLFSLMVGSGAFAAALADGERQALAHLSIALFEAAREEQRRAYNHNFRNFLMSRHGEGFTKLMILSMDNGTGEAPVIEIDNSQDPRVKFIKNLTRAARVCSPEERRRYTSLGSPSETEMASARERAILRYACDTNLSTARFQRMRSEFLTFNMIPQDYVNALRTVGRENRLRMGELLIQLQFLDGDRDPKDVSQFSDVVSKILGFDNQDDIHYFDRLETFIRQNGGIDVDESSPTGFGIANKSAPNPYDLKSGFILRGSPEPSRNGDNGGEDSGGRDRR